MDDALATRRAKLEFLQKEQPSQLTLMSGLRWTMVSTRRRRKIAELKAERAETNKRFRLLFEYPALLLLSLPTPTSGRVVC